MGGPAAAIRTTSFVQHRTGVHTHHPRKAASSDAPHSKIPTPTFAISMPARFDYPRLSQRRYVHVQIPHIKTRHYSTETPREHTDVPLPKKNTSKDKTSSQDKDFSGDLNLRRVSSRKDGSQTSGPPSESKVTKLFDKVKIGPVSVSPAEGALALLLLVAVISLYVIDKSSKQKTSSEGDSKVDTIRADEHSSAKKNEGVVVQDGTGNTLNIRDINSNYFETPKTEKKKR